MEDNINNPYNSFRRPQRHKQSEEVGYADYAMRSSDNLRRFSTEQPRYNAFPESGSHNAAPTAPERSLVNNVSGRPPGADEYNFINRWSNSLVNLRSRLHVPRGTLPSLGNVGNVSLNDLRSGMTGLTSFMTSFGTRMNSIRLVTGEGFGSVSQVVSRGLYTLYVKSGRAIQGMRSAMPKWENLYYSLMFMTVNPSSAMLRDTEAFDELLITTSNETSVQYYSHDLIENMKLKIVLKEIDLLSAPNQSQSQSAPNDEEGRYKTHSVIIDWQQKIFSPREILFYHGLQEPQTALDLMYTEDVNKLIHSIGQSDYISLETCSPYMQDFTHGTSPQDANDIMRSRRRQEISISETNSRLKQRQLRRRRQQQQQQYGSQKNSDNGMHSVEESDDAPDDNDTRRNIHFRRRRRRRYRQRNNLRGTDSDDDDDPIVEDNEDEEEEEDSLDDNNTETSSSELDESEVEDEESEAWNSRKPPPERRRRMFEQFTDLLTHPLFTYVDSDPFETDAIQLPFYTSSTKHPSHKMPLERNRNTGPRPRKMYIMANCGNLTTASKLREDSKDDTLIKWDGHEYPLCIITYMSDGTLIMRPGLSELPVNEEEDKSRSKFGKQSAVAPTKNSQRYKFRTKDGKVYEYTLHLYNDTKKNKKVEDIRKRILQQMYDRSLLLRRNLIGNSFSRLPNKEVMRMRLTVEIVSARGFECTTFFIRYFAHLPESYTLEDSDPSKLSAATQMAVPECVSDGHGIDIENEKTAHFGFTFSLDMLTTSVSATPTIFFQVMSKDFWNRYRTEGYGYRTVPHMPTAKSFQVGTWKPKGGMRNDLRSYFVGGSPELNDVSMAGVPCDFYDTFLNKHDLITSPSGSITIRMYMTMQT